MRDNAGNHISSGWIETGFIDRYLDYREGLVDEPPSFDGLTDDQRRDAEWWIESLDAAQWIDPWAETPSIEDLCQRNPHRHLNVVPDALET